MNRSHYSIIWALVGLTCLYYALNAWVVTQGGSEVFPAKLIVEGRVPIAVLAFPICGLLLILVSAIGIAYARSDQSGQWHKRIPVIGFKNLNTHASRPARIYQILVLVLLSVVPGLGMVHFTRIILGAHVAVDGREVSIWDFAGTATFDDPARICAELVEGQCVDGVTFFPGWQAYGYCVLALCVAWAVGLLWGTIFLPKRMPWRLRQPA